MSANEIHDPILYKTSTFANKVNLLNVAKFFINDSGMMIVSAIENITNLLLHK